MRNKEYFAQGNWALVNPSDEYVFEQLANRNIIGFHQYFNIYTACQQSGKHEQHFAACFSLEHCNNNELDGAVIYMPKAKQQLTMLLQNVASLCKQGGVIFVVGENKGGIKSVATLLKDLGTEVVKVDSAKHCALYAVTLGKPPAFNLEQFSIVRHYQINQQELQIYSLPGVFGHKQLDAGTKLLLEQMPEPSLDDVSGHIYDFACGTGVIGCYLGKALTDKDIQLSMSDVSALAVYCAQQSCKLNNVKATVSACDGVVESKQKFDHIVSNPPFHEGLKNNYQITESFIHNTHRHSNNGAKLQLVANAFLPYPQIIKDVYGSVSEMVKTNKYVVYSAKK